MLPPQITADPGRLAALDRYAILDTPDEPEFDGIVQLAALICAAPVALVSLVSHDRQWFKARFGFEPRETDIRSSVCAHALAEPDLLIIPDLTQDNRARYNPLVTEAPHIRFYAGAPLRLRTGETLGSLCVIDTVPRPAGLTAAQCSALRALSLQVTALLDMRRAILERDALARRQSAQEARQNALLQLSDALRELNSPAEMTALAMRITGQTIQASRVGFSFLDEDGAYREGEADWTIDGADGAAPRLRIDHLVDLSEGLRRGEPLVIHDVARDPRTEAQAEALLALGICALVKMPVRERGRTVAVLIVHDRQKRAWRADTLGFLRSVADRLELGIARLKAEAEQRVLNYELSHRLKNSFAMIQAIAKQSLRSVPDQVPVAQFLGRLHALSSAHDVLLQQTWGSAVLGEIAASVLGALAPQSQFSVSGPEIEVGPRAALAVSLVLHELATNATKYGALSCDDGRIALAWRVAAGGEEPELVMEWRESGGPPPAAPGHTGFGSRLIQMGLTGTGGAALRYPVTGFEADFRAPLAQAQMA